MGRVKLKKSSCVCKRGADMLWKYVTDNMVSLVGLLKYVSDFQKITSGEIVRNVKNVTKSLGLIVS